MHLLYSLITFTALTSALPSLKTKPKPNPKPLPLLIWHGLGDRFDADGLQSTGELAEEVHPGTFVYYIRTDEDGGSDRTNTFFGNVTTQLAEVCAAIHDEAGLADPDNRTKVRADALGFSQGGQFLRALVEACEGLSVRSLVTFGSQHNGIAEFQECGDFDFVCKGATGLIVNNVWTDFIQGKVVPAQYYREVNETTGLGSDEYLKKSNFLAHINNEKEVKVERYKEKIAALERFVMYVFKDDETVIPKETGWFADVNATSGEVTSLKERRMYKEDWLGLKKLDEKGGLVFKNTTGKHMELSDKDLRDAFLRYFGPERDFDAGYEVDMPGIRDHEQALVYASEAREADDAELTTLWLHESDRIRDQIRLAGYTWWPEDDFEEQIEDDYESGIAGVEDFPGYQEWIRGICKSAHAEDEEEKRMWLHEANRIMEQMRADGYEMEEVEAEAFFYFDEDEEWPEEDGFAENFEGDEIFELDDEPIESPKDILCSVWVGQGGECGAREAQAALDAMSWWTKRKAEWNLIWRPWFRGELQKPSDVESDVESDVDTEMKAREYL
jgi:palmitoyl-protein thioesterase